MRSALIGLALLPMLAGGASAHGLGGSTYALNEAQLDRVTAGATELPPLSSFNCPGCAFATSSSASNNGVTTTTSSSGVIPPPTPPSTGGGGSSGGGSGGSGGSSGGGSGGQSSLPTVPVPPAAAAFLNALSAASSVVH